MGLLLELLDVIQETLQITVQLVCVWRVQYLLLSIPLGILLCIAIVVNIPGLMEHPAEPDDEPTYSLS